MYTVGQWIFYGNVGACLVTDVLEKQISASTDPRMYYVLQPLSDNCSISTPVDNVKVFTRPLISREEAEKVIEDIPQTPVEIFHCSGLRQLSEHYESMINTHDCRTLLTMIMSIHAKKLQAINNKKKLGAVDEKFMRKGEELLLGELSVVLGREESEVASCITSKISEAVHDDLS